MRAPNAFSAPSAKEVRVDNFDIKILCVIVRGNPALAQKQQLDTASINLPNESRYIEDVEDVTDNESSTYTLLVGRPQGMKRTRP